MKFEIINNYNQNAVIKVIGVGAVGCHFVKNEVSEGVSDVECVLVETHPGALQNIEGLLTFRVESWAESDQIEIMLEACSSFYQTKL